MYYSLLGTIPTMDTITTVNTIPIWMPKALKLRIDVLCLFPQKQLRRRSIVEKFPLVHILASSAEIHIFLTVFYVENDGHDHPRHRCARESPPPPRRPRHPLPGHRLRMRRGSRRGRRRGGRRRRRNRSRSRHHGTCRYARTFSTYRRIKSFLPASKTPLCL